MNAEVRKRLSTRKTGVGNSPRFRGMSSKVVSLVFGRQNGKQVDRWKEPCVAESLCSVNLRLDRNLNFSVIFPLLPVPKQQLDQKQFQGP